MRDLPQLTKKPGTALVLSGGATKAFYFHLGVLKALQIPEVTSIVGSSAGAVIGTLIAAGATVDQLLAALYEKQVYLPKFDTWVKTLTSTMLFKPRYTDIARQMVQTGLAGVDLIASLPRLYDQDLLGEALTRLIQSQGQISGFFDAIALENLFRSLLLSPDFADLDTDLYVVATDLDNHKRGIFNGCCDFEDDDNRFMSRVPIHKAVRASTTIPGMFTPVKIKGRYYVDGEVKHTLSVDIGLQIADTVIVSHTYQPFVPLERSSIRELGWVNILRQALSIVLYERINIWRQIYSQEHPDQRIIWISPNPDDQDFFLAPEFSFNPDVQKQMINCGEIAALKALETAGEQTA
jgi:NTE family protein